MWIPALLTVGVLGALASTRRTPTTPDTKTPDTKQPDPTTTTPGGDKTRPGGTVPGTVDPGGRPDVVVTAPTDAELAVFYNSQTPEQLQQHRVRWLSHLRTSPLTANLREAWVVAQALKSRGLDEQGRSVEIAIANAVQARRVGVATGPGSILNAQAAVQQGSFGLPPGRVLQPFAGYYRR